MFMQYFELNTEDTNLEKQKQTIGLPSRGSTQFRGGDFIGSQIIISVERVQGCDRCQCTLGVHRGEEATCPS